MHFQLDLLEMERFLKLHPTLLRWVMDEDNAPSSQSEYFSEHPFRHYDAYSVFPPVFFFYLSAAYYPIYVLTVKPMSKSLRTNCENANESANVTGISASFCVGVAMGTDRSLRNHLDVVYPEIFWDWATGLIYVSDCNENWVRTTSAEAHDLP